MVVVEEVQIGNVTFRKLNSHIVDVIKFETTRPKD